MELLTQLQEDMKVAMKAGQKDRLGVIRMLLSDVKNIDLAPKKTTAEEAVAAYGKKLRKGIEEYEKYGKANEVQQLRAELAIVDSYLPQKLSPDDTAKLVNDFLSQNSFTEKQAGQATGAFMKAHGAKVEPGPINGLIRQKLAGK
jgi:uncharacterized protein YqeY